MEPEFGTKQFHEKHRWDYVKMKEEVGKTQSSVEGQQQLAEVTIR